MELEAKKYKKYLENLKTGSLLSFKDIPDEIKIIYATDSSSNSATI